MRLFFGSCFTLVLAAIGLGATWFTLTRGVAFGSLTIGAWTAWPKSGSVDIDPYARASIARTGELPIGRATASPFTRTRRSGDVSTGADFLISGMTPAARYWTLTLYDPMAGWSPTQSIATASPAQEFARTMTASSSIKVGAARAARQLAADRRHR